MVESKKKTILLAEDDASMRRFIEIILNQANFEVIAAEDGLAALEIAFQKDIDVLVADAIMPNLSGFDLCRMINDGNDGDPGNGDGAPSKKRIPCIILSGLEYPDSEKTSPAVADAFLIKDGKLRANLTAELAKLIQKTA